MFHANVVTGGYYLQLNQFILLYRFQVFANYLIIQFIWNTYYWLIYFQMFIIAIVLIFAAK